MIGDKLSQLLSDYLEKNPPLKDYIEMNKNLQQELDKYKKITEALEIMEDTYLPEETDFILLTKKDYLKHEKELPTKEHIMLELVDRNIEVLNLKKELDKYKAKEKELREYINDVCKEINKLDNSNSLVFVISHMLPILDILDRKEKDDV